MRKHSILIIGFLMIFVLTVIEENAYSKKTGTIDLEVKPEEVGNKIVENLVSRQFGWRYQKVCSFYGSLIFADASGNNDITKEIEKGFAPYLEGKRKPRKGHVDFNVFGIWPFELYRQTGKEEYLKMGKMMADHEFENPREDGLTALSRFWVDDMYMVGSLQIQAFKSLKDEVYLDRAALHLATYLDSLQRPNGLFYHRADAPHYWGRGNGWGVSAMVEIFRWLPTNHVLYPEIVLG